MDRFEYKMLSTKRAGLMTLHWFDGDKDLGPEITTELLSSYGQDGWEVAAAMTAVPGTTDKIILKRRIA